MSISCLEGVWRVFRSFLEDIWVMSKIFPTPLFGTKIHPISNCVVELNSALLQIFFSDNEIFEEIGQK